MEVYKMDDRTKQYWINRITKELQANKEPIWYDTTLVRQLDCFKIIETDINYMSLITFKA
jgi:hypothetical protein